MVVRPILSGMLAVTCMLPVAHAAPQSFPIKSAHVLHDGMWHADPNGHQTVAQCGRFHMSDDEATKWFQASREVDQHQWLEGLDWTQCSASGTLLTGDGRRYGWTVDQSGRGQIVLSPTVSVWLEGKELPFSPH